MSPNQTIREVVLQSPRATRVFEELKIDYCCGGESTLVDACANVGVGLDNVIQMLNEAELTDAGADCSPDFQQMSLTELTMHILDKHHVYTKREMPRLEPLLVKVMAAHGENHPELLQVARLLRRLCEDLQPHMFKEEQILFPYIVQVERSLLRHTPAPFAPFGTVDRPAHMMMLEHDRVGDLLRELREASAEYRTPVDGCLSYQALNRGLEALEKDLHQHIHLENNVLFPRAIEMERRMCSRASKRPAAL